VTTTFWILAAAMSLAALAFVAWPLARRRPAVPAGPDPATLAKREALEQARRAGALTAKEVRAKLAALETAPAAPRHVRVLPLGLAVLLPLAAIVLYREIGEPRALDPVWQDAVAAASGHGPAADAAPPPDMDRAVAGLAERLKNEPDDLEGWMLLGRAYKTMERFEPAREALAQAFRIAPENPDVMVEYAEAQVLASPTRRFDGEPLALLQRAVQAQPQSQRGLWLLGIASYQKNDFAAAATTWEQLLAVLPEDAEPRAQLLERIADARQQAGLPAMPAAAAAATARDAPAPASQASAATPADAPAAASAAGPRLTVTVDITPELKARVGASDVLFVFARAAEGPRMPLAIQRLPASALPVTVTLDDSTSMMPALKLSTMPRVVVGARISKSGQATPQAGDFETLSAPIANTHSEPMQLLIDEVVR
jgi:cytochrome c-type biogenesis protein CcmH